MKDGSILKGMVRMVDVNLSKKKHITGTGEINNSSDGTVYKGALVKG